MLKEKLINLNFTPNQVSVYLALLELGETKVGSIIKKTGFHRNIIYRALDDLIAQKLVSKITHKGIFYYSVLDPSPILNDIKQQETIAQEVVKEIKSKKHPSPSELMILSGSSGILDLYEMIIEQGKDIYLLGATFDFTQKFQEQVPQLKEKLDKANIIHLILAQSHVRKQAKTEFKHKLKFLPKYFPPSPHVIWISGNIVAHVIWEEPEAIFVIKNKKIADNYRSYFKLLWKK